MKTITIPIEEYNSLLEINEKYKCLRGHLNAIEQILGGQGKVGSKASERQTPKPKPKETKQQRMDRFERLINAGARAKKPNHLKK